jgi:hypothetical protein
MAKDLRELSARTPAQRIAHEAIELAIEGRSPYPDKAVFIDADAHSAGGSIRQAVDEGRAVVLVSKDGSTRILHGELASA